MKKFLTFISILFLTCTMLSAAPFVVIVIRMEPSITKTQPRSAGLVPVECLYNGLDQTVSITYLEDIGSVSVTVTNRFTGETFVEFCDSSEGTSVIQTTGSAGDYHIFIEAEGGMMYEGDFCVE